MPNVTQVSSIEARWLDALQRLAARSAHELRGALNGVSVNVEVIRSRAAKATASAGAVAPFADAASAQLDDVIELTEALLGLARPTREPIEIATETKRIVTLLSAAARADSRRLSIDDVVTLNGLGTTSAPGSALRWVVCECLIAAVEASAKTRCVPVNDAASPAIRIELSHGETASLPSDLVTLAAESGIDVQVEPSAISISFPR
jgi:signal transduction histidine kinase